MSLRAFHFFFICVSIVLTVVFAMWGVNGYIADREAGYLATSVASFLSGAGLMAYGVLFWRKTRRMV